MRSAARLMPRLPPCQQAEETPVGTFCPVVQIADASASQQQWPLSHALCCVQRSNGAPRCKVPVALEEEIAQLALAGAVCQVECDPAVVPLVWRNAEARIHFERSE